MLTSSDVVLLQRSRLLALAAAAWCASAALAAGPQIVFSGRITGLTPGGLPPPWGGAHIGDPWRMTICYDPTTPNVCDAVGVGCYPAIREVLVVAGSAVEGALGAPLGNITVISAPPHAADEYRFSFHLPSGVDITLTLTDPTGAALQDESLLACEQMPDISAWRTARFEIAGTLALGARAGDVRLQSCSPELQCGLCPPCTPDYNADGGIDGQDVEAFFIDWENGLRCADVNRDGGVDGSDVQRFFRLWENGSC
ncbi:MAG: hypothetical protein JSR77_13060 [Planctomycetes bacterium]|nr:hypothetical protein [Planctomycetota bacterium]